ncbi:hypothetical protein D3C87_1332250 [compost metagenome]
MAVGIVHELEAVEIDKQHGKARMLAGAGLDGLREAVVQQRAVRQMGELVVQGQEFEFLIRHA